MLEEEPAVRIVADVSAGDRVAEMAKRLAPDVILASADIRLPALQLLVKRVRGLGGSNVLGLVVDPRGLIWITRDHDSGLTRFDPTSGTFAQFPLPPGVVPRSIAVLGGGLMAVNVYHTDDPSYEWKGANLDTGYLILNVRSGTAAFTPGLVTNLSSDGRGRLLLTGIDGVSAFDPELHTTARLGTSPARSIHPGLAVSPLDGTVWRAAGNSVEHLAGSATARYLITPECGPAPGAPPYLAASAPVCASADASSVSISESGIVGVVAGGYNSVGFVYP